MLSVITGVELDVGTSLPPTHVFMDDLTIVGAKADEVTELLYILEHLLRQCKMHFNPVG